MAYLTTAPGIEEARLDAIHALLVANLASLNASLQRDGLWPANVPITPSMVTLGHPATWPASRPPILICVVAGGRAEELDIRTQRLYIELTETSGFLNTLTTSVYLFLHPDAVPGSDPLVQAAARERIRVRLSDWARAGVFNTPTSQTIPLDSHEVHLAPTNDYLDRVNAVLGYKGLYEEGFGGSLVCYGAHIVVEGIVG
jgi:hypothetical protein